ncbi:DegT/DnrJ/EryC1/StrS family aminotransferase [Gilliamella sp. B3172]|uniref:DegT/DnrJ/EryC1/StrS family aminotransferase n=1 Tax=Gilliamella sp. B3172 TaxID=2818006 RepID=UPI003A5CC1A5
MVLPYQAPYNYSSFHLYPILLQKKGDRKRVFDLLRANKIGVNVHYIPIHTQPYYRNLGFKYGDFPNAEQFYSNTISLPIYYSLAEKEQEYVIKILSQVF